MGRSFEEMLVKMWSQIDRNGPGGCWIWTGCVNNMGYGKLNHRRKMWAIHRLVYQLAHGTIPNNVWCLHRCDVPRCVNPAHIFLGDDAANTADMIRKGRAKFYVRAKLNHESAAQIRRDFVRIDSRKCNAKELAARHGVNIGAIYAIVNGKTWGNA